MAHPLDNPGRSALTGPHAHLAEELGGVLRYPVDVCPFWGVPDQPTTADWAAAASLAGPEGLVGLAAFDAPLPGWERAIDIAGVQMTWDVPAPQEDPEAVMLGAADVPEILALIEQTRPGPFLARTVEMGTYLGLRRDGRLVAMAGERLHPPGWTEISAVCTDPAFRGQGLAARLMRAVAAGIVARGELPFLHAAATNTGAIRLYESMGFRIRRDCSFTFLRPPAGE